MRDPAFDLLDGQRWAELEDFYVLRPDRWLERREVDAAGARSAVIAARKLDIVKMKTGEAVALRFEMQHMIEEPEIFFDLRMSGVMPVDESGAVEIFEQSRVIGLDGQFLDRLAVLDSQFDATGFGGGNNF